MVLDLQDETREPAGKAPGGHRSKGRFRSLAGWQKALILLVVLLLVLIGGLVGGGWFLYHRYDHKVAREDILPADAAAPPAEKNLKSGPINLLLLGSDSRATEPGGKSPIGERSDTIMLVHIAAARNKATIISIPRDSFVDVPAGGAWKGGKNKINAAFAYGGAKLTASTVRKLTGVSLDGVLVANFASVRDLVDAVDGVNVCVPYDVRSTFTTKVWRKGCHQMDGDEALEFVRQRYEVPGGDFGRINNQQLVIKAVTAKASAGDLLTDPIKFDNLMVAVAGALTVDKDLDLQRLALAMRNIRPGSIMGATVPHTTASLKTFAGSAVQLDEDAAAEMFAAVRNDTINQWLTDHPTVRGAG